MVFSTEPRGGIAVVQWAEQAITKLVDLTAEGCQLKILGPPSPRL